MDEDQKAVIKSDFQFKTFRFEEGNEEDEKRAKAECNAFKDEIEKSTGKRWADVGHVGNAYYTAYSRVGEITALALEEAGRHFNLRASITGNYIVGRSWKECH